MNSLVRNSIPFLLNVQYSIISVRRGRIVNFLKFSSSCLVFLPSGCSPSLSVYALYVLCVFVSHWEVASCVWWSLHDWRVKIKKPIGSRGWGLWVWSLVVQRAGDTVREPIWWSSRLLVGWPDFLNVSLCSPSLRVKVWLLNLWIARMNLSALSFHCRQHYLATSLPPRFLYGSLWLRVLINL